MHIHAHILLPYFKDFDRLYASPKLNSLYQVINSSPKNKVFNFIPWKDLWFRFFIFYYYFFYAKWQLLTVFKGLQG